MTELGPSRVEDLADLAASLRDKFERSQLTAKMGRFDYDLATDTWTSSRGLDALLGIDASFERTRAGAASLVAPVWRPRIEALAASVSNSDAEHVIDFEIVRPKDGTLRWIRVTAEPVTQRGRPTWIVGTVLDIDELVRCNAVRQAILEATDEGVLVVTHQGVVRHYNRRFCELWQLTDDDMTRSDDRSLVEHVASQLKDPAAFAKRVELLTQSRARADDILVFRDGRAYERFSVPLLLDGQDPERLWLFRDITNQAQATTTLGQREALLAECQRAAQIGSWEFEVGSGRLYWTEECYRIYGVSPRTFEPNLDWLRSVVLPEDLSVLNEHYASTLETDSFEPFEYRIRTPDGRVRWVHVEGALERAPDGSPFRMYGTQQDVTTRKEDEQTRIALERRFLHSQKTESLGALAGGIAHDFNNLLMVILGNLDLALPSLPEGHPAIEDLEQAIVASRKARELTQQMLAYSGRSKFALEPLDLGQLVQQSTALLRTTASRLVDLELRIEPSVPPVLVDRDQFQQIVMNLVTNASEAIGDKPGLVTISIGARDVGADELEQTHLHETPPPGTYVFLRVEDTGCGMSQETLERLFDPFFTTKHAGRGLGMSAILGIVRAHHGAIFVRSGEGDGTCIEILLPAQREASNRLPSIVPAGLSVEARPTSVTAKHILLVDDEDSVRRVCEQMLKRLGWSVLAAANGQQAVEIFREHARDIACVVLDWSMPHMNGLEVFKALRRIEPSAQAILSSGYAWNQGDTSELSHHGIAGFIQKPYELDALERELRRVLDK